MSARLPSIVRTSREADRVERARRDAAVARAMARLAARRSSGQRES